MCGHSPRRPQRQQILFVEVIPVLRDLSPGGINRRDTPISPDTSLPWSGDFAHHGWSAKMYLHQMLSTSRPAWKPSDTESLLSRLTLEISPVRVGGGKSLSEVLEKTPPASNEYYLTAQMVAGLIRHALKRRRPLQRVLLRTPHGWRRRTVIVGNLKFVNASLEAKGVRVVIAEEKTYYTTAGDYVFSLPRSVRVSRDSQEVTLLAFLARAVRQCLETQSPSRSPSSSDG